MDLTGLEKRRANFAALSPLQFIERAAKTFPDYPAVVHGSLRRSWAAEYERCRRLGSVIRRLVGKHEVVATMLCNTPEMFEMHYGVPMAGAVLLPLNYRLDASGIAFCLTHGQARVLVTDSEFASVVADALRQLSAAVLEQLVVIDVFDVYGGSPDTTTSLGSMEYEAALASGDAEFQWSMPADEWDPISLLYTSGTTGDPKGVVLHHRGAYLNAVGNILSWGMGPHPSYLWTLPMFHCNGWCFPWTLAIVAGTNVCLRKVEAAAMYQLIAQHKVTHLCGAPIVMQTLINAKAEERREFQHKLQMMTAAAPPPAAVLEDMERLGINITHVYGLTEVYGPAVVCAWHQEWNDLQPAERAKVKARQGVRYPVLEGLSVMDPETMLPVKPDGQQIGEVFMRGNIVMRGYLKNTKTTDKSFEGGWFHTGDLAVLHSDGYIELKDRSKDIIISGGENISSIEIQDELYKHPDVIDAAVVAKPDTKWGEVPCAFIMLKQDATTTAADFKTFLRDRLAHFKVPKAFVFGDLPKTSTGKVQKFVLRQQAKELGESASKL